MKVHKICIQWGLTHTSMCLLCHLQLLHLCAVERALAILEPPLKKDEATMIQWLNNIRISQNTVDSILSLPSETDLGRRTRYMCGNKAFLHTQPPSFM